MQLNDRHGDQSCCNLSDSRAARSSEQALLVDSTSCHAMAWRHCRGGASVTYASLASADSADARCITPLGGRQSCCLQDNVTSGSHDTARAHLAVSPGQRQHCPTKIEVEPELFWLPQLGFCNHHDKILDLRWVTSSQYSTNAPKALIIHANKQ